MFSMITEERGTYDVPDSPVNVSSTICAEENERERTVRSNTRKVFCFMVKGFGWNILINLLM